MSKRKPKLGDTGLPPDLVDRYLAQELTLGDVGRLTGLSASTVSYRLHRAGMRVGRRGRPRVQIDLPPELLDGYASGQMTAADVAQRLGRTTYLVLRELRRAGLDTSRRARFRFRTPPRLGGTICYETVVDLYHQGWSLTRIGQRFDVSRETIRQILIRQHVPRRPCGTATAPDKTAPGATPVPCPSPARSRS